MAFDLRINFSGQCVCLPETPGPNQLTVLLPEERIPVPNPFSSTPPELDPHFPEMIYPAADGRLIVHSFHYDTIRVRSGNASPHPLAFDSSFADRVVSMEEIAAGAGTLRTDCRTVPPSATYIVGRFLLEEGTVRTSRETLDDQNQPIDWILGNRQPKPLATHVEVTIPIAGNSAVLECTAFGSANSRDIPIAPQPNQTAVDVLVKSFCARFSRSRNRSYSFYWYYRLCQNYGGPYHIPERKIAVAEPPPILPSGDDTFCPLVRFP